MYQTKFKATKAGLLEARAADIFIEQYIKHVEKEYYDKPFCLEDWQYKNMLVPVFGSGNKQKSRRLHYYLFMLPRIHGKSEIAPAILLAHASLYPQFNAEYGLFASSKAQAGIIYKKISTMIRLSPQLSASWEVMKKEIVNKETGARIRVFPANDIEAQGIHFTLAIIDEMHVIKNAGMYEAITSGMEKDSVLICITTAGEKRAGFLYDVLIPQYKRDKQAYIYWVGVDENDKPEDRSCWHKAQVASWVDYSRLEEAFASHTPSAFMRYYLNQFPADDESAAYVFTDEELKRVTISRKEWDWNGRIVLGIDGATSGDSFALVYARRDPDGKLGLFPIIFDKSNDEHGHYDLTLIEELIASNYAEHNVELTAIDPARLLLLSQHMENQYGIEFEAFAQSHKLMCPACGYLMREVVSGRVRVYGPQAKLFIEHLRHTTRKEVEPYGFRFNKANRDEKIDAAIAAAIANIKLDTLQEESELEILYV